MPVDYSKYPDNWHDISLNIRFVRAGGRCECKGECGTHQEPCAAIHGEPHPITGSVVVLTVMHLDHDTENNDGGNLMAACQKCHLTYDADFHAANAAATRRRKQIEAGQLELFDAKAANA